MTLTPAYGDYKSGKAAKEAFDAGQDFRIADIRGPFDGQTVNKPQFSELGGESLPATVQIRFKALTGVCVAFTRKPNVKAANK